MYEQAEAKCATTSAELIQYSSILTSIDKYRLAPEKNYENMCGCMYYICKCLHLVSIQVISLRKETMLVDLSNAAGVAAVKISALRAGPAKDAFTTVDSRCAANIGEVDVGISTHLY